MLTDSHCHLASHRFAADEIPELVGRARAAGVTRMITLATELDDLDANLALAAEHAGVLACLGIHPCSVAGAPDDFDATLRPLLADPRVAAVGETGLDYFHPAPEGSDEEGDRARQREFLRRHFELAAEAGLNLVIHTRDRKDDASFRDALSIYRDHHQQVRAVFHCFVQSADHAQAVLDLGGLVSFGGVATFKNAPEVRKLAATLPAGTFMLETDSPYLSPHPRRGERNEPAHVRIIAEAIADARGESIGQLAADTGSAAAGFFRGIG